MGTVTVVLLAKYVAYLMIYQEEYGCLPGIFTITIILSNEYENNGG